MLSAEQGGWRDPQGVPVARVPELMKSWLKENAGRFRVQRFVDTPAEDQ